ncbi:MAG TPA: hypothetical protein VHL59_16170 [Thermoanaerobaculia bacterium]|nr:hypothetical protein [Thermoanaerobaculia bacterium]
MKRELGAFALFLALATAMTWPLALHLDTAVPDRGDPLLNAFIIDWVCHALTHAPWDLYDAPIYHTGRYPLAYSENMAGIALVVLPFHLAGASALTTYNIALLLGFAFSGYGASVLARLVTRNPVAALVAGIFYAFASFKVAHVQHVQIVWSGWLPLLLAALLVYWRRPTRKSAALLGAAFVMNGLTNIHWLLFGGFALVVTIAFLAAADPRRDRAFWFRLAASLLMAGLILVPFLIPYQIVANEYGARRTTGEARLGSATPTAWLVPSSRNALYGDLADPQLHRDERELFPGLLVLFLAAAACCVLRAASETKNRSTQHAARSTVGLDLAILALIALTYLTLVQDRITLGRFSFAGSDVPATILVILLIVRFKAQLRNAIHTSRFNAEELSAAVWIAIGFVASLGWYAFLHPFLFRVITPFRATRTPARWAVIAYVGLAVWAAIGVVALLERTKRKRLLSAVLLAFAVVEVWPDIRWQHIDPGVAPVYRWLARERPRVAFELPMIGEGVPFEYVLATSVHRVPIINGTSGWETRLHELLRRKEEKLEYDDAFLGALAENGAEVLIVHEARLSPEQKAALAPLLQRLEPVQRFGSDAVFRIPRAPAGSASAPRAAPPR